MDKDMCCGVCGEFEPENGYLTDADDFLFCKRRNYYVCDSCMDAKLFNCRDCDHLVGCLLYDDCW